MKLINRLKNALKGLMAGWNLEVSNKVDAELCKGTLDWDSSVKCSNCAFDEPTPQQFHFPV